MRQPSIYIKVLINLLIAAFFCLLVIFVLPKVLGFFLPFVIGWIIAMIANPLIKFLEKKIKIKRKHGSVIFIILILGLIIFSIYFIIHGAWGQILNLWEDIPTLYLEIEQQIKVAGNNLNGVYEALPEEVQNIVMSIFNSLGSYMNNIITNIAKFNIDAGAITKNVADGLLMFIITLLASYFIIVEKESITNTIEKITPISIKEKYNFIINTLKVAVGGYFKAQFKIMSIIVLIICIGLAILKVEYAVLIGILIAFLDFLPFFGTGTILTPWAIIEFFSGNTTRAIGLITIYLVSQIVRQLIQPKILGDSIGLSPFATLIFMYIGLKLKGILGMIIGVPVGMIIINLYKAGMFNRIIKDTKFVIKNINDFRRL